MKISKIFITLLLSLSTQLAHATFMNMDGMMFNFGYWGEETDRHGFRVAPRWNWDVEWLSDKPVQLTGYWEAGVGYWRNNTTAPGQHSSLYAISGSPMLQIWLGKDVPRYTRVFLELGVGPAYLTQSSLGNAELGSNWQFEDKFGAGLSFQDTKIPFQFIYRYYHYSNAGIWPPNRGLDLHTFGFVCFF